MLETCAMPSNSHKFVAVVLVFVSTACMTAAARQFTKSEGDKTISEADRTVETVGSAITISALAGRVSGITLNPPRWVAASGAMPAHCVVDGSMAPVDRAPSA